MSGPKDAPTFSSKIYFLQALRAIAAWLVVADHDLFFVSGNDPHNWLNQVAWAMGDAGVYMFFVISGFIMVVISWKDFGQAKAATTFLERRITRVVPLYWLATLGALGFHVFSGTQGFNGPQLLRSFLFVPPLDAATGRLLPVLQQGWSLTYEMMFYGLFACTLIFRRKIALPALVCTLLALVGSRPLIPVGLFTALASPIVLWFVFGVAVSCVWCQMRLSEPRWLARSARAMEFFGDASYSTYLSHGMVLTLVARLWAHFFGYVTYGFVPVGLVLATAVGCLAHVAVEKPILRIIRRVRRGHPRPDLEAAYSDQGQLLNV